MPSAQVSFDDFFQILSFFNRPQLFKFLFINRLILNLLEKHFTTKPYANAILRIWTEEAEEGQQEDMPKCRTFAGIAILDNFMGNQEMHQKIINMTKFTRKWQWYLDREEHEIHPNDIEGLKNCRQIVQFYQDGNHKSERPKTRWGPKNLDDDDAYWTYSEEEACFVHQFNNKERLDEDNAKFAKQLQINLLRAHTKMSYIKCRDHLIANNFEPNWQWPMTAKYQIPVNNDGTIEAIDEFQQFLNSHLNSQKYVRLLSVEFSSPQLAWSLHKNVNNIIPQISVPNDVNHLTTNIPHSSISMMGIDIGSNSNLWPYIILPKSIIITSEDFTSVKKLTDFIYQQSSLDLAVQIQLPKGFLEKELFGDGRINQRFLQEFSQELLRDFLIPNDHPYIRRAPFICKYLIHPSFLFGILMDVARLNLSEFKKKHQFRRINYDADREHMVSMENISPDIQRLNIHADYDDKYGTMGTALYDSSVKDYWRLNWTQLSGDLCEIKICQWNEDRDTQFHKEFIEELAKDIGRNDSWFSLTEPIFWGVYRKQEQHFFDRIGPFLDPQKCSVQNHVSIGSEAEHFTPFAEFSNKEMGCLKIEYCN